MTSLRAARTLAATLTLIGLFAGSLQATTITFEGESSSTAVTPSTQFVDQGFTFTPSNSDSAIYDPTVAAMSGNPTDFFGFVEGNTITLTATTTFNLTSLDLGISSLAGGSSVNFTIRGYQPGDAIADFSSNNFGVSTQQTQTLNWTGLSSVTISASDDAGFDNVVVTAIPEPSTYALGLGVIGLAVALWRRRKA